MTASPQRRVSCAVARASSKLPSVPRLLPLAHSSTVLGYTSCCLFTALYSQLSTRRLSSGTPAAAAASRACSTAAAAGTSCRRCAGERCRPNRGPTAPRRRACAPRGTCERGAVLSRLSRSPATARSIDDLPVPELPITRRCRPGCTSTDTFEKRRREPTPRAISDNLGQRRTSLGQGPAEERRRRRA